MMAWRRESGALVRAQRRVPEMRGLNARWEMDEEMRFVRRWIGAIVQLFGSVWVVYFGMKLLPQIDVRDSSVEKSSLRGFGA